MLVVALVALAANAASVFLLRRHDRHDVNVRAAFLHMAQDALASLAVVVAAGFAHTGAGPYVDAVAALLIGLVVLRSAWSLAWETLSTILEGAPADIDLAEMANDVAREFSPASIHHVHVWELGPSQRVLTAHVSIDGEATGRDVESLLSRLKRFLHERWDINHATLEPEISACDEPELLGRWEQGWTAGPNEAASSMVDDPARVAAKREDR